MPDPKGTPKQQPKSSGQTNEDILNEYFETPEPPGPNETMFVTDAERDVIQFQPDIPEEADELGDQISSSLSALYDGDEPQKIEREPAKARETSEPSNRSTSEADGAEGDEIDELGDIETPIDFNAAESTNEQPGKEDTTEGDPSKIVSKYLPDLDEESYATVQPLGKAMLGLQQQNSRQAQEIATLKEQLAAKGEAPPTDAPEQKAEANAESDETESDDIFSSLEVPAESELENIIDTDGFQGLYKRVLSDATKALSKARVNPQGQPKQYPQVQGNAEVVEHNAKLLTGRAKTLLREQAIAKGDKTAAQRYADESYQISEQEFIAAQEYLAPEIDALKRFVRINPDGKITAENLEAAKKIAYHDKYLERAEQRGYQKALRDKNAMQPARRPIQTRVGPANQVRKAIKLPENASPRQIKEMAESLPPNQVDAILAKYQDKGLF